MKIVAWVEAEVKDRDGNVVFHKKKEANSLVRSFIDSLYVNMAQSALPGCKAVDDTVFTGIVTTGNLNCAAPAAAPGFGIAVGTGTAAVTVLDTKLGTRIAHGSGAGQLSYLASTFTTPATVGSTHSFTASRGFTNLSGGTINVTEVGLQSGLGGAPGNTGVLSDRTLMSFAILNGATGTVTYTIQVSV